MKKLNSAIATLALVMYTFVPARAQYLGTLPKDQEWAIEVTSSASDDITLTVYYLGHNVDLIDAEMTVHSGTVVQRTFPKPGARVKRIVVEVDTPPGGRATLRFAVGNGAFGTSINLDDASRLVFNSV